MYFLSKELQSENINWTDDEYDLYRTKDSIKKIMSQKALQQFEKVSDGADVPLSLILPSHNTKACNLWQETNNKPVHQFLKWGGHTANRAEVKNYDEIYGRYLTIVEDVIVG